MRARLAKRVIKDVMTLDDAESYSIARLLAAFGVVALTGLTIYSLLKGSTFDPLNWATGYAAIIAAGCFGSRAEESK